MIHTDSSADTRAVPSGTWYAELYENGHIKAIYYSEEVRHLLGYGSREEFPDTPECLIEHTHPDDARILLGGVNDTATGKSGGCDVICRLRMKSGEYKLINVTGKQICTPGGKPFMMHGACIEVPQPQDTCNIREIEALLRREQKKQQELQEAAEQISSAYAMVEGLSHEFHTIWVVDKDTSRMRLLRTSGKSTIKSAVQIGKDYPEFETGLTKYVHTFVEPQDRERLTRELAFAEVLRQLAAHGHYEVNYLRRTEDGKVGYHQIAFVNADTANGKKQFVYGFRDIDAMMNEEIAKRRKLEEANRRLEENIRLQRVVAALSREYDSVYAIDLETEELTQHKLSGRILKIVGKKLQAARYSVAAEMYIANAVATADQDMMRRAMSKDNLLRRIANSQSYTKVYLNNNNEYCEMKVVRTDDGSLIMGFAVKDKAIRQEMLREKELEQAKNRADAANRAKSTFLFNMSHDIRTPMNAIIGFTTLALEHIHEPDKLTDYLSKTMVSSRHLLSLINDVLDMSRIETGKMELVETACSLSDILHELNSIVHGQIQAKHLNLCIETGHIRQAMVCADKLRLHQILLNLISNAIKFTPSGGSICVHLTQKESPDGKFGIYEFKVRDTGIGIDKEFQNHIFEMFERERTSTVSRMEGTGLGMAITKYLVDMMHGTITVESEPGHGSEFTVTLPLRFAPQYEQCPAPAGMNPKPVLKTQQDRASGTSADGHGFAGRRLLLAEDNDLNQEIACAILTKHGFVVETAKDGSIALKMLQERGPGYYDAVLMDIQMPVMDGYAATQAVRSLGDPKLAGIPIIAMTANAFQEDRQRALEVGMNSHIPKPIDIAQLIDTLRSVLSGG